jgi:hypothetical protein
MPTNADLPTTHARGVLAAASDAQVSITIPGTDYRLDLEVYQRPAHPLGKRIAGTIRGQARRVDIVKTGGRYIEPVAGKPRRVQGVVAATDSGENSITVDAVVPIVCRLTDARQRAEQFRPGDLVAFDLMPGASFTPALS